MTEAILNLPPSRWKCTAAKAAAVSLPRNLEAVGLALRLPVQKNMDGRRLMLKHSKPRPVWQRWNKNGRVGVEPDKWFEDSLERMSIQQYCVTDTDVERHLDNRLPDLAPSEQYMWELNQRANLRGVEIDLTAVKKIIVMIKSEEKRMVKDLRRITRGFVQTPNQRDRMLKWLRDGGLKIDNLRAGTVKEILERDDLTDHARGVLTIRALVSKTSNKKYFAFVDRTCENDRRARDLMLWHGANTGRGSAVGIQIHNFPRGKHKDTDSIIEDILNLDMPTLKILYGDLFQLFSSCLRGMIKATGGCELFRADYNAIECRVLNWLAFNLGVLEDFAKGVDQYKKMAARIYGIEVEDVDGGAKDGPQRFLGKIAVLACGYGMGHKKFLETCEAYGVKGVTREIAKKAVQVYRETHHKVVQMWYNVEKAAISAVKKPGYVFKVHRIAYFVKDDFLWCVLPSGRRLAYYKPFVKMRSQTYLEDIEYTIRSKCPKTGKVKIKKMVKTRKITLPPKESLHYSAVNSQTRRFEVVHTYGGSLVENLCQAISADVMREGIKNAVKRGFVYLFDVHDELVCEFKKGQRDIEEFIKCLVTLPKWANGLPVKAEGWAGPRFRK